MVVGVPIVRLDANPHSEIISEANVLTYPGLYFLGDVANQAAGSLIHDDANSFGQNPAWT